VGRGGTVRYSEAFKLQVIRELEEGQHASCNAASEAYRIAGSRTVQRWLREYGREHLVRRVMRVETTEERSELQRLKGLDAAYLEMACEAAGIEDVEAFKKKHGGARSTK
jgi:transposase-like protein